jgi:hypothetical protein
LEDYRCLILNGFEKTHHLSNLHRYPQQPQKKADSKARAVSVPKRLIIAYQRRELAKQPER